MLIIISNRFSHDRKTKRRVLYQPEQEKQDMGGSMFEILKNHKEQEGKKQQDLDRRFHDKLRNTASGWQYSYLVG